jgi:hypothetical protein
LTIPAAVRGVLPAMHYDYIAISDAAIPLAVEPAFQHAVTTYASEANKTVSVWRAVPDDLLDFKPHEKTNTIRTILVHQLLSERRFLAEFVGLEEPPVEELLPPGEKPAVQAYIEKCIFLAGGGYRSSRQGRRLGGWRSGSSSAVWCVSGSGCSGGGSCTPATSAHRSRRG